MALAKSQSRPDVDGVVGTSSNAGAGQEARLLRTVARRSMQWGRERVNDNVHDRPRFRARILGGRARRGVAGHRNGMCWSRCSARCGPVSPCLFVRLDCAGIQRVRGWVGPAGVGAAFGVFCGYLVLDAPIANTDRHEENWAVIRGKDAVVRLCASYDHATSLGFNLSDERRHQLATEPGRLHAWLERGTARRFEGGRRLALVSHAVQALDLAPSWAPSW